VPTALTGTSVPGRPLQSTRAPAARLTQARQWYQVSAAIGADASDRWVGSPSPTDITSAFELKSLRSPQPAPVGACLSAIFAPWPALITPSTTKSPVATAPNAGAGAT